MQVDHQWRDNIIVTSLVGELDTPVHDTVWEELQEIKDFSPRAVVLDLSRCSYIASIGISLMVRLTKEMRALNTPIRIAGPSPAIRLVLDTVNLASLIPVDGSVEQAVANLQRTETPWGQLAVG